MVVVEAVSLLVVLFHDAAKCFALRPSRSRQCIHFCISLSLSLYNASAKVAGSNDSPSRCATISSKSGDEE